MTQKRPILDDHKKVGKIFIAPMNYMIGPIRDVSWVKLMIPELLWIGLIQFKHGHRRGVELITSMARSTREICPEAGTKIFHTVSSYSQLSSPQQNELRTALAKRGDLFVVQESLSPLLTWYPDCPLGFLLKGRLDEPSDTARQLVKNTVSEMYRRSDRDPMMVQATAIWLAFDADVLKVAPQPYLSAIS